MVEDSLDYSKVVELARQLRVNVTDEEARVIARDLSKVLEYVRRLGELHLEVYEPTYSVSPSTSVLREDTPQEGLSVEDVFTNAVGEKGFIKAPKI
ncbi:MAG: Asp-tRNA(Asn)/Glu-tRNA(Gln) amidotransferase subunit GatC [Thermoprotei archaeon]